MKSGDLKKLISLMIRIWVLMLIQKNAPDLRGGIEYNK